MESDAGAMTGEVKVEEGIEYWVWIGWRGTESPCMMDDGGGEGGDGGSLMKRDELKDWETLRCLSE